MLQTPDATVKLTSPPLPLTRGNLKALGKMTSQAGPSTPGKGSASQSSSSKKSSKVPASIRGCLEDYNILVNKISLDTSKFDPDLAQFIEQKILSTRSSPTITKAKHEEIDSLFRQYEGATEATISAKLADLIFTRPGMLEGDTATLECTQQTPFRVGSVPIPDTSDDPLLAILLRDSKVPENPAPDYMFGLKDGGLFSKNHTKILKNLKQTTRVAANLYFPFLTVEWKSESHGGNAHVARSQAARSGAAIVSDMRNLYAHTIPNGKLELDSTYPDLAAKTACFSCIISGWLIEVWVHWFRFNEDGVIEWHSTSVMQTRVRKYQDDFVELHRVLHNIFDWGTSERLGQIRTVLELIDRMGA